MANADAAVWSDVLTYLRKNHPGVCRQWFEDIEVIGADGGIFSVRVPKQVQQQYLERECTTFFNDALQHATGRLLSIRFGESARRTPTPAGATPAPSPNGHARPSATEPAPEPARADDGPSSLEKKPRTGYVPAPHHNGARAVGRHGVAIHPDYTFDSFVEGPENRLALAAARAVAQRPGQAYNPLFLHGGVGLGKTHLLQAICVRILDDRPDAAIYYTSCEGFMTEFLDAVETGQMTDFRHRFRGVDVLVIDDIHFLTHRERTQEEFFHTFNALYQSGKQIVISSDAPPQDIPDLEARLVSRFLAGLVMSINPPCYETRIEIVKRKARVRGVAMPDEVAAYIAGRMSSNIREIEGAIVRVLHQAEGRPVTEALAREALNDPATQLTREVTIEDIIRIVTEHFGIKLAELQSKRRQKSVAHPRQVCMYLARRHTRYSLEEIGGYFGGRDHTTVMHAERTVEAKRSAPDGELDRILTALEHRLGLHSAAAV
jgi:chromosomal replication initiator protein